MSRYKVHSIVDDNFNIVTVACNRKFVKHSATDKEQITCANCLKVLDGTKRTDRITVLENQVKILEQKLNEIGKRLNEIDQRTSGLRTFGGF